MKPAILVIDRFGLIGESLSLKLSKEFPVVFVSKKNLNLNEKNRNIVCAPFARKFPVIPDSKYSHIVFIDEEGLDIELLPKIINKVKAVNADFIFVQGLSAKGEYLVDKILQSCPGAKIVISGDIFGNKLILRKGGFGSVINKFIYQAQEFGKIQILGDGLKEAYPVLLNDVVGELINLVFGMHRAHTLFYLFPEHPPTELSLAHMIQKINPEIMIDFARHDPRLKSVAYPPNGLNLLHDKYPLAKKIRGIDIKKNPSVGGKAQNRISRRDTKKLKNFPFFVIWIIIFLLLFPFIFTLLFSFLGENTLNYAKEKIDSGNFTNAKSSLHLAQTFFYVGKQAANILSLQAKTVGRESNLRKLLQDLDLDYKTSEALLRVFDSEIYFVNIFKGRSKNPVNDFSKGENYLKDAIVALNRIKAEGKNSAPILQNLGSLNPLIKLLLTTSEIMPSILGMERQKTYLILFQINMSLRPGGGKLDLYGILKLNMGKITEFSIHDVSDADEQLRGHVEPPFAVRRHLQEQHWYMKDSNFDVDFTKSASSSSNFLFAETGQKADGVIAIDVSFIKDILHATGPLYVTGYKEVVDENNLYTLMQKEDYFRSLIGALKTGLNGTRVNYLLIAQAISDALLQKHLLFVFNDSLQNIFTVNGWSSSLWDERKESVETINDFLGINEANLGMNNINDYIKRQVLQKVTMAGDGTISEELNINYKNESSDLSDGDYKNYLRIILPKNARLSEITINGLSQSLVDAIIDPLIYEAKNFQAPDGLEIEKAIEGNKAIFGFIVNVPPGKVVKVKLKYTLAGSFAGVNTFSYNLKLFKQPGTDGIPYSFSLIYPESFNAVKSSHGVREEEGKALYSEKIIGDKNLIIDFAKK